MTYVMQEDRMAKVTDRFISQYLNNKLLDAILPLNQVQDAVDPSEQELIKKLEDIKKQIISIEV